MSKQRTRIALLAISLLSIFWIAPARAQAQDGGWSEPYRLSSEDGKASEAYLVADQYGYVHAFWTEALFRSHETVIKYARFDGAAWTKPNDIYVADQTISKLSPSIDEQGILHLAWGEGLIGPAYYTSAPASSALSAQNWAQPIQINVPSRLVFLRVDSSGVLHVLYINETAESGVYYIRSEDGGITWSESVWLDPDIPPGHKPDSLNFEIDVNGGLHAVWVYGALELSARPDWVRYAHSPDGGNTWPTPFTIDKHIEGTDHNLNSAGPLMIVDGQTVHVIWAAGSLPFRNHRYSTDAGQTWSAPEEIFGELHGQAFDGAAVDGAGRVHFFGQIRYPMGIYHAYWDQTSWSKPTVVYFIADTEEAIGDRVHAHFTRPVIRDGNQLVLTFTDGPADPNRRLFVMYRTLDEIAPLENIPTPVPSGTPVPISSPAASQTTAMPQFTATSPSLGSVGDQPVEAVSSPGFTIWVALVPTLLILGVAMIIQLYRRRP